MHVASMSSDEYRAIRESLGLTQDALAQRLGVSRRTVLNRESGRMITEEARLAILGLAKPAPASKQPNK